MALGESHITTSAAANFIPELWALDVLEAAEKNLVMANLVTRFDDVAAEGGDVIYVPKVTGFSAQDKSANAQVQPQTSNDDKISIPLSNHKEVSFLIEDITAVQAKSSLREIYTKKAGYAIAKAIDSHLLGLYSQLSQAISGLGAGATPEGISSVLATAMGYLDMADAPDDDRALVVSPAYKPYLLSVPQFVSRDYMGSQDAAPVATGHFGQILGAKVFVSSNVAETADSGGAVYHNLMFSRNAFALAIQLGPRVQANYVPEYLGTLVTVDVIYGYAVLNERFAVDIQS